MAARLARITSEAGGVGGPVLVCVQRWPGELPIGHPGVCHLAQHLYSNVFWGNSAETMVAQLVAEEFDVEPHNVNLVYSGSNRSLPATGPGGSRFTVMVAGAIRGASQRIKDKMFKVGAYLLVAIVPSPRNPRHDMGDCRRAR